MARWWGSAPGARVESIAERKVREAMERGEFDDLPGQGQPLKNLGDRDPNWWVKGLLEREQLRMPLPTSLELRREAREIGETVADCRTETAVRDIVDALNDRILDSHRRRVDGPPVVTATLDVEAVVACWRERRKHVR